MKLYVLLLIVCVISAKSEDSEEEVDEDQGEDNSADIYKFLYKRMKQQSKKRAPVPPAPYRIVGPQEPLPGRSHNGDYWPVFPFANQFSAGLDLDPSESRHIGGDVNIPMPSWGMLDITGHFFNRTSDTTTKLGYVSQPINMLGLTKKDFTELMSDPALHYNRNLQPLLPLGKVPKSNVPMSCRPPMCNPYTQIFSFGLEHDLGGTRTRDGYDGDINVPIPIGKDLAYRLPIGGNVYFDLDNITVNYAHNLAPVDPYQNPFMFNTPGFYKYFEEADRLSEAQFVTHGKARKTRSVLEPLQYPQVQYPHPEPIPYSYRAEVPPQAFYYTAEPNLQYPRVPYPDYDGVQYVQYPRVQYPNVQAHPYVNYRPLLQMATVSQPVLPYYLMSTVSQSVQPNIQFARPLLPYPKGVNRINYYNLPYVNRVRPRFVVMRRRSPHLMIRVLLKKRHESGSNKVTSKDFQHPLKRTKRTKRFYSIFDSKKRLNPLN